MLSPMRGENELTSLPLSGPPISAEPQNFFSDFLNLCKMFAKSAIAWLGALLGCPRDLFQRPGEWMVNRRQCYGGEQGNGQPLTELKQKVTLYKYWDVSWRLSHFYSLHSLFAFVQKGFLKNNFDYIFALGQITFSDQKQRAFQDLCVLLQLYLNNEAFRFPVSGNGSVKLKTGLTALSTKIKYPSREACAACFIWEGSPGSCDSNGFLLPSKMIRLQTPVALLCGKEVPSHPSSRISNQIQPWTKLGRERRFSQCHLPSN